MTLVPLPLQKALTPSSLHHVLKSVKLLPESQGDDRTHRKNSNRCTATPEGLEACLYILFAVCRMVLYTRGAEGVVA